jgi:uncharacterized protein
MDFDWQDPPFPLGTLSPKEIEESFEDPFAIRLLPDSDIGGPQARYFNLGHSLGGAPIFSVFWTDGKNYRIIVARGMTEDEVRFLQRKNATAL